MENKWYVLKVTPGKERQMNENFNTLISLNRMDYVNRFICPMEKEFVVLRKKKVLRDKILYSGYLYFETTKELNDNELKEISSHPFVMSMLGDKKPRIMGKDDIRKIIKDEALDEHKQVKLNTFLIGENVVLTDGPFASFNGVIIEINGNKVELQVKIFGRLTSVTIDIENIKKI